MIIKQYFTDGLVQIAIILSLLRTDLNNYLHSNLINYPEVQDVILGQSIAYSPANFHNHFNILNSLSVHPKSVDHEYFSSIFQEVRSLPRFQRFYGLNTNINAFLVETNHGLPLSNIISSSSLSSQNTNEEENDSSTTDDVPAVEAQDDSNANDNAEENSSDQLLSNDTDVNGAVSLSSDLLGSNLTSEDLDLIEVLWRQDIDLGVGKDVFDVDLRRKLEQERELELQQQRAKQKQEELIRQKKEEEKRQLNQQWLSQNFMQDGETGEWLPLEAPAAGLETDIFNASHVAENFSLEEALQILSSPPVQEKVESFIPTENTTQIPELLPVTNLQQTAPVQPVQYFNNYVEETVPQFPNHTTQPQQLPPAQNGGQADSFLECLADLLDFNHLTQEDLDASRNPESELLSNTCQMNNSNVLIQNATLPQPAPNNTLPTPLTANMGLPMAISNNTNGSCMSQLNDTAFLSQAENFSSTVPAVGSFESLDWEAEDIFSNVTTMNQPGTLANVSELVLHDEAIRTGLQTMDMMDASASVASDLLLDEVSEDSAIESMGSASPFQHEAETVDGVEGATGGSDYGTGSPDYSKTSKLEPDDFRYSYSGFYSGSESPHTNCSTSSNDTDFNRPSSGPPKHVKHNHTYPLQPGETPREVKAYTKVEKSKHKGPYSRDEKRICELNIPFSVDQIIDAPVEEFNDMMSKYKLTEPQIQLIRDIRRRGKNKVAAHNCRKRKMGILISLEDELEELKAAKDKLLRERSYIDKQTREMKEKFSYMYREIFNSLRDEHGNPYDANEYSLQQLSDGNVFLVPRPVPSDDSSLKTTKKRKNDKK